MDLETFRWLLTEPGQALLAEAEAGDLGEAARLRELTRLRRLATPEQAAAAYEQALLRRRAAAKFSQARTLYFVREALEQASGEQIAAYRAQRYAGRAELADMCCGIGGDALALARVGRVLAVDRDELRLAVAAANARTLGLAERVTFLQADVEQIDAPAAEAIFFDPARRNGGRRVFALADYRPPLELVGRWLARVPAIGVKLAPGVADDEVAALIERIGRPAHETEFISLDGELKEAVLWLGPLAGVERRATVLRSGQPIATLDDLAAPPAPLAEPLAYLYEPDPAVIRAHVVAALARRLGAAQLDRQIAYLTGEELIATPFARCWRVLEWQPFGLKRLRARLRALGAGAVTVKKRGSPLDTDALARQLSGDGPRALVVVLTNVAGRPAALIGEGPVG